MSSRVPVYTEAVMYRRAATYAAAVRPAPPPRPAVLPPRLQALLLALLLAFAAFAVPGTSLAVEPDDAPAPFLFANLITSAPQGDSDPSALGTVSGSGVSGGGADSRVLFTAFDGVHGRELWRTDGTPDGTELLADLCPGGCSSFLNPVARASQPGLVFFHRGLEATRGELWRSDGTAAGTFSLATVRGPSFLGTWSGDLGLLFFRGEDAGTGSEPWVTDGTVAGTRRLADLAPGAAGSAPESFRQLGGAVYFSARDPEHGREIWRTDGTAAGTQRVTDLVAGPADGVSEVHGAAAGCLLISHFQLPSTTLWSYCPGAGARLLVELSGDPAGDPLRRVVSDGRRFLLQVQGAENVYELWASDGTPQGTRKLLRRQTTAFVGAALFDGAVSVGGRTVFRFFTPETGIEPWATDGTAGGTRLLADLCPGTCSSGKVGPVPAAGGALVLDTPQDGRSYELWATDGTAAGTTRVIDLGPSPVQVAYIQGRLWGTALQRYVEVRRPDLRVDLWRTDGSAAGTRLVRTFRNLDGVTVAGASGALLAADDGESGSEPWWTGGTTATTRQLADVFRGDEESSFPRMLTRAATAAGPRLFFTADLTPFERGLWVSDGSVVGTRPVPGSPRLEGSAECVRLVAGLGGVVCFAYNGPPDGGADVWWSDGRASARKLAHFDDRELGFGEPRIWADRERLFVFAQTLWTSDGTAAGTRRLPTPPLTPYQESAALQQGVLFFPVPGDGAAAAPPGVSVWRSDGTPEGTQRWLHATSWSGSLDLVALTADGRGGFWFVEHRSWPIPDVLWHSDGSPEGTRAVSQVPTVESSTGLWAAQGRVYFPALDPDSIDAWWVSDGTAAGTRVLAAGSPQGASVQGGERAVIFQDALVYVDVHGDLLRLDDDGSVTELLPPLPPELRESLQADARQLYSAGGKLFVVDVPPRDAPPDVWLFDAPDRPAVRLDSPFAAFPPAGFFTALGPKVYFAAHDPTVGEELWALSFGAPLPEPFGTCIEDGTHLCLDDGRFRVHAAWRDPRSGDTGVGRELPLRGADESGAFWFFHPGNLELVVKILDGRPVNGHFWAFHGALTDVEYTLGVEDLDGGRLRTYRHPTGPPCGRADVTAFPAGPPPPGESPAGRVAGAALPDCADPGVLCLGDGRYRAEVTWSDPRTGASGGGTTRRLSSRSGLFWFFQADNPEVGVKVLDGGPVNGHTWVFHGALTDLAYELRVVDAESGLVQIYSKPAGRPCGAADTSAFAEPPSPP